MSRQRIYLLALSASLIGVSAASGIASGSSKRAQDATREAGRFILRGDTAKIYTEEQAAAGQAVFTKTCSECHETKDVTGADFRTKWKGQTVFALFEQIRTTMPDGNPGTLSRDEYIGTVAYILKLNGLPSGTTPLATDSTGLAGLTLDLPAASQPASR